MEMQQGMAQEPDGPLSLTGLEIENVLRIKAVSLTMEPGGAVILEGRNEQGKSSVLRSLEILLSGMSETPPEPLHGDAKEGSIVATFGDIVISKTFKHGRSPALSIRREGKRQTAPQTLLNEMLDRVALDPLKFLEYDDRERLRVLSDVMGFDSAPFDLRHDKLYAQRRDANRDVKRLEIELKAQPLWENAPGEEVSVAGLAEELKRRRAHNTDNQKQDAVLGALQREEATLKATRDEIGEKIVALKKELALTLDELGRASDTLNEAKIAAAEQAVAVENLEYLDEQEVVSQMAGAEQANRRCRDNVRADELRGKLDEAQELARQHDVGLEAVELEREHARLAARERLPVPELDITRDSVLYRGKPLSQAGSSAQLRVSVAVALSLNKDKRVKLLLIDDAEKLDPDNTKVVLEMAREAGFQVLMARVGDGASASVLIEDGEVKG